MIRKVLVGKTRNSEAQFLRSLPVAAMTSAIDFGLLIFLTEYLDVHYLTSATVSFLVGQLWSYTMYVSWIFAQPPTVGHTSGFTKFVLISVAGLGLTVGSLWYLTEVADFHYLLSKVVVSAVIFQILFQIRRKYLFS